MTKHTIIFILSLIATASSITGNIFINHKRKVGFIIWTMANMLWILINCIGDVNYNDGGKPTPLGVGWIAI